MGGKIEAMMDRAREQLSPAEAPEPAPRGSDNSMTEPLLQVVEVQPIIRAMERLSQQINVRAETIAQAATEQHEYLRETKRAHNAITADWYKIAEHLPRVQTTLEELELVIAARQEQVSALGRLAWRMVVTVLVVAVVLVAALVGGMWLFARHKGLV